MALSEKLGGWLERWRNPPPVVGVVRLSGIIGSVSRFNTGMSLASVAGPLEQAFKLGRLKAVALAINSPGGSPVQSTLILKRIRALAEEKKVPVYAFAEDVAASGGYMLALAADEIYADDSSVIGSIGVISAGFGFKGLIEKIGVERRVHTSGERKAMLDPFSPEDPADVDRLLAIQREVHDSFKDLVRSRREGKLKAPEDELFSGEFWTGKKAAEMGLIDGLGDMRSVMRRKFGDKVQLKLIGERRAFWQRRLAATAAPNAADAPDAMGGMFGTADQLIDALEARALWSRYGL